VKVSLKDKQIKISHPADPEFCVTARVPERDGWEEIWAKNFIGEVGPDGRLTWKLKDDETTNTHTLVRVLTPLVLGWSGLVDSKTGKVIPCTPETLRVLTFKMTDVVELRDVPKLNADGVPTGETAKEEVRIPFGMYIFNKVAREAWEVADPLAESSPGQ
jgi:hypothetical protein